MDNRLTLFDGQTRYKQFPPHARRADEIRHPATNEADNGGGSGHHAITHSITSRSVSTA